MAEKRKDLYDWPKVLDEVCDWLASGRTIRDYSRQDGKPTFELIYRRVAKDADLGSRIARARAEGADAIAEEALAIVDQCAEKPELAAACKVRFEGRLKLLSKWNSGRYGDKTAVEHSGTIGDGLTDQQRTERLAEILKAARARKKPKQ